VLQALWALGALLAAVFVAAAGLRRFRKASEGPDAEPRRGLEVAATLAFGLAYLAGHAARLGWPRWRGDEHQPFFLALAVTAAAALLAAFPRPWTVWLATLVSASVAAAVVIVPGAELEWRDALAARWIAAVVLTAACFAASFGAAVRGRRDRGASLPLGWLVLAAAAGANALRSSYAKLLEASGVLGSVVLPVAAVLALRRRGRLGTGPSLIASAVLSSILMGTFLHTLAADRAPAGAFVLLAGAQLTLVAPLPRSLGAHPRRWSALRWAAVVVLAAGAVGWGWTAEREVGGQSRKQTPGQPTIGQQTKLPSPVAWSAPPRKK
jgi:hypothetical protein